jgi:hypothetical protein
MSNAALFAVFDRYCGFGHRPVPTGPGRTLLTKTGAARAEDRYNQPRLDSFRFAKLAREVPLLQPGRVTATDVDIAFSRAKARGERRLSFVQFLRAVEYLAERMEPADGKENTLESVKTRIASKGGPDLSPGTVVPEINATVEKLLEGVSSPLRQSPRANGGARCSEPRAPGPVRRLSVQRASVDCTDSDSA